MDFENKPIDKEIRDRLLYHGLWLSDNSPPLTKEKALVLIGQAMLEELEEFIENFTNLWKKDLFPHIRIKDYQATEQDWKNWLGSDYKGSKVCKEVNKKMDEDTRQRLDGYLDLLEEISEKTDNESTAVALLHEIAKDRRSEQIRQERGFAEEKRATDKQKSFMKKLGIKFPKEVTKQEASALIDQELGKLD